MKDRFSALWLRAAYIQRNKLFFWIVLILGPAAFLGGFFADPSSGLAAQQFSDLVKFPLSPFLDQDRPDEADELGHVTIKLATAGASGTSAGRASRHRVRTGKAAGIFRLHKPGTEILLNLGDVRTKNGSGVSELNQSVSSSAVVEYEVQRDLGRFWNISRNAGAWKRCPIQLANKIPISLGNAGFLMVVCNGGLNQKRAAIADAVAVAWIMNRTLVLPVLETDKYWGDASGFSSIFNESHFIESLKGIVRVVRETDLPKNLTTSKRVAKARGEEGFYHWLARYHNGTELLVLDEFSHKLSYIDARVSPAVQRIRCFTNLEALRFTSQIEEVGNKVVQRLRSRSGLYVAVHLRFEQDMLAHAKCEFEGSDEEREELQQMRETFWPYRNHRDNDTIDGNRKSGRCPLSPEEVGRTLHYFGFPRETTIYVASGPVYKAEKSMPGLANLFPNLVRLTGGPGSFNITSLLDSEEQEKFGGHADQLAALDYFACAHADVFMPSFTGNMDFLLEGERRYAGFRMTIVPNRPRLAGILPKTGLSFQEAQKRVYEVHPPIQRFGMEPSLDDLGTVLRHRHSVFSHPLPECMCYNGKLLADRAYNASHR